MRFARLVVAAVAAWSLAGGAALAFGFADARAIVAVREAQISPDGSRVAFVQSKADFAKNRNVAQLMLLDVRTRRQRPLTYDRKGVSSLQWSPDGATLLFLANDGDDTAQVFAMPMDGGDARAITHVKNGVDAYALDPSGTRVAFETADDNPNQKAIDAHHDAFQVGDNDYLHKAAAMPDHVWLVAAGGGAPRRLTSGTWSASLEQYGGGSLSWSADGKVLAIVRAPTPYVGDSLASKVMLVDVASGAMRPLTRNAGLENAPSFAPRGSSILYQRNTDGNAANGTAAYLTTAHGGPGVDIRRKIDRNVDDYAWDPSGNGVYLLTPDGTENALWYRGADATVRRVATGAVQASALGNVANDGAMVFVGSTSSHPNEVYLLASPGAAPTALTDLNAATAKASLGFVSTIAWTGPDGFKENGVLTYPPGRETCAGKCPLPLVLLIHGGPQGASNIGWSTLRQLFASHGYLVFEPNYRGSTNSGDAYERAIARNAGDGPGKDVMAGVAAVEKTGRVDPSRIAVSGWSYGGFMTSWLIGHYHIWKAAVSGASLDDWFDDYNVAFYTYTDVPFFGGVPSDPKYTAMWRAQSPITYATQITTPTLILGDIGDNNVTITNSFKLYHALKDNGVPVEFVAYPVPGHHPSDPVRNEDINQRWLAWLDKYLK
jgi:dipeptidyl aminopeptidase/acylaminoacyl peptidase